MLGNDAGQIEVEELAGCALVTIARPQFGNRLGIGLMKALRGQIERLQADERVAAIGVTGAGDHFCLGGDGSGSDPLSSDDQIERADSFIRLIATISAAEVPVVSIVNGDALAGGFCLANACDMTVAAMTARFGFTEIDMGLMPTFAIAMNQDRLPPKLAFELAYSGRLLTADEAAAAGLVNKVVAPEELRQQANHLFEMFASRPRKSVAIGRRAMNAMREMSFPARAEYVRLQFAHAQQVNAKRL